MFKRVFIPGLLGGLVLLILTFVMNGLLGFKHNMEMKQIPNESQVYELLKNNITEPGRYLCNPALTPEERYPDGEPVFSVLYSGFGHEGAGSLMLSGLFIFLLSPMIAAWLLSHASTKILSSFIRKVLFFSAIGLLFALFSDLQNYGIGNLPLKDALIFGLYNIVVWTIVGLVVAWRVKPE